jgi:hypothetical protein
MSVVWRRDGRSHFATEDASTRIDFSLEDAGFGNSAVVSAGFMGSRPIEPLSTPDQGQCHITPIDLMRYIGDFLEVGYTRASALPARSFHF